MGNISLVSKLYSDKETIINTIKSLGRENGLQIIESHETTAPNCYDFGWWLNLSDDEIYQVEFWVAPLAPVYFDELSTGSTGAFPSLEYNTPNRNLTLNSRIATSILKLHYLQNKK